MIDFGVILILFWFFKGRNYVPARLYFSIFLLLFYFTGYFDDSGLKIFLLIFFLVPFRLLSLITSLTFIQGHFREAVCSLVMTSPILANSCFGPSHDNNMTINNETSQFWQNMCFLCRISLISKLLYWLGYRKNEIEWKNALHSLNFITIFPRILRILWFYFCILVFQPCRGYYCMYKSWDNHDTDRLSVTSCSFTL